MQQPEGRLGLDKGEVDDCAGHSKESKTRRSQGRRCRKGQITEVGLRQPKVGPVSRGPVSVAGDLVSQVGLRPALLDLSVEPKVGPGRPGQSGGIATR
jgi:hypothetical protein